MDHTLWCSGFTQDSALKNRPDIVGVRTGCQKSNQVPSGLTTCEAKCSTTVTSLCPLFSHFLNFFLTNWTNILLTCWQNNQPGHSLGQQLRSKLGREDRSEDASWDGAPNPVLLPREAQVWVDLGVRRGNLQIRLTVSYSITQVAFFFFLPTRLLAAQKGPQVSPIYQIWLRMWKQGWY